MAERRNNKLEVKLQLMKGKELDQLSAFARKFETSVGSLVSSMGDFSSRIESALQSAAGASTGLGVSPRGTVAGTGPTHNVDSHAQQGRQQSRTSAQAPSQTPDVNNGSQATPKYGEEEIRIQQLMANPRRAFTTQPATAWAIGKAANALNFKTDEAGNPTSMGGKVIQAARNNPQAAAAGAATLAASFIGHSSANNDYRQFAQQAGLDTGVDSGWQSLPVVNWATEGGRQALRAKASDTWASLAPNWSRGQALELRGTMASMGMTEDPGGMMKRMMQSKVSQESIVSMTDWARRYRGGDSESMTNAEDSLKALADSASAAGMSVEDFSSSAIAVAAEMSRSMNIDPNASANWSAYGTAYGFRPEETAKLTTGTLQAYTIANGKGSLGQRKFDATHNPELSANSARKLASRVIPGIENYPELLDRALKGDLDARDKVGEMQYKLDAMGGTFGDMGLESISNLSDPKKMAAASLQSDLGNNRATHKDTMGLFRDNKALSKRLKASGVSKDKRDDFFDDIRGKSKKEKGEKLSELLGQKSGVNSKRTLGLTPEAQRLVKLMDGNDGSPHEGNRFKRAARSAVSEVPLFGGAINELTS